MSDEPQKEAGCMFGEPQKEHAWLQQLIGRWTYTSECDGGPGQPPMKANGEQTTTALGGFWIIGEGRGEMPGGGEAETRIAIGYDPARGGYVGTWIGSMMPTFWVYAGRLDPTGKILTLEAEGPSFSGDGTTATYNDVIEIKDADTYLFHGRVKNPDGTWTQFMTSEYRRVK